MELYKYTGDIFICNSNGSRIQPSIVNLETGEKFVPVMTNKNKAMWKFHNYCKLYKPENPGFYFTANYITGWTNYIKNVKFYTNEEFAEKWAEYMI